jgi:hypothetical protein
MTVRTTPPTPDEIVALLKKWKIQYVEYGDWRNLTREGDGRPWGPLTMTIVHNFGSDISDENSMAYLRKGDFSRGLPPPLAPFGIDDEGIVYLIGSGRSNHAGPSDIDSVKLLRAGIAPTSREIRPDVTGSAAVGTTVIADEAWGTEMTYGVAPTAKQREAIVRLQAALCDFHGWSAGHIGGHRELTTNRVDPVGFSMFEIRREVAAMLKAGPPAGGEELVATEAEMNKIADLVVSKFLSKEVIIKQFPEGATMQSYWTMANVKAEQARDQAIANGKQVAALAGTVAAQVELLKQVASGVTAIDYEKIEAAAKAGTDAAFDERVAAAVAKAQVELEVTPSDDPSA